MWSKDSRMDRWLLMISTLLAVIGGVWGMWSVHLGRRSRWTVVWMGGVFLSQLAFLWIRGQQRMACPLADRGEVLVYLSWSLTLFYLLVGPAYRISLLGVFTAPVVMGFQGIAMLPGMLDVSPQTLPGGNPWHEAHSSTSVLGGGALALAGVAAVMFLVLDRQLKEHHLKGGLFRNLPPVRELLGSIERLLWLGVGLLTLGMIAGGLMPKDPVMDAHHQLVALAAWLAYAILLLVKTIRGMTGRKFSLAVVVCFVVSLVAFSLV